MRGSVTRLLEFGAFVRIAAGIEGLLHVSELGGKVAPSAGRAQGRRALNVVVRSVDRAARKIALVPAPEGLAVGADGRGPQLAVGAIVSGKVDRVEPFGVFLQVDGTRGRAGRGLIPNAELGTPRGADTRKLFPVGTPLTRQGARDRRRQAPAFDPRDQGRRRARRLRRLPRAEPRFG